MRTAWARFKVYRFNPARDTYASAPAHAYLTGFSVIGNGRTRQPPRKIQGEVSRAPKNQPTPA